MPPTIPARQELRQLLDRVPELPPSLSNKLSAPLVISIPDEWWSASSQVMIIGQETYEWGCRLEETVAEPNAVDELAHGYVGFDFAEGHRARRGAFWRAHRHIADSLEHGAYRRVLWSNLVRVDYSYGGTGSANMWDNLTWEEVEAVAEWQKHVLSAEIRETGAQAAVFLTGPRYDFYLSKTFPGARFDPFPGNENELRRICIVRHDNLPDLSIRTYHPSYLQRRGLWPLLTRLTDFIKVPSA
jgi:hypothetical protein